MNNKLYLTLILFSTFIGTSIAQNYALVEHFTNTHCPICSRKNPQLYNVIADNSTQVHHIAYHPPYPYDACIFYQANIEGNQTRADFYNVPGSPSSYVGGQRGSAGSDLLSSDKVAEAIARPLMVEMNVEETDVNTVTSATQKMATIAIKTVETPPAGTHKLFVAVVEKEIKYNSPNGESVHHDVFRKMLPSNDGEDISFPAPGEDIEFSYTFDFESGWQQDQIYVVAFIQNIDDKSIIGSATKFDQTTTPVNQIEKTSGLTIQSNPVQNLLTFDTGAPLDGVGTFQIVSLDGKSVISQSIAGGKRIHSVNVSHLPAGTYILRFEHTGNHFLAKKFIKQ